ncbi:ABC transporter ATP-binding protein [Thalassovita taeanensis]|uniref:Amino acid/amide ABC transporter ATP-binding protein 2, HAAT family n=1 Tax=Thalassovita taeanensis TaxID=657014 RepID=A0A1H9B984_9RHOB|nr:ABC transporter ATP-binding protein [Thalassovita taeanensis]SEP85375.1 amino acid/amide ABC transporter ATP-binding protein 2, HAAT family [Thalassovita taeanensis]
MSDPMLRLEGVYTDIAQYHILQGVDLDVPRGGVTMLLGRNGVGKTTTLRTIMGHWRARAGKVMLDGQDITALPVPAIARTGVGFVPENMGIFSDLTVEENMVLAAVSGPIDQARLDWIFEAFPPLKTFWKNHAGNLSGGQKQMLSIARAMVEERRLYLIDEPTKGLAPAIISTMARALRDLKAQGASILLVEQNFSVAKALGDTCAVMDDGRVIWSGAMAELAGDAALQERLMGLSMEAHQ